MSGRLSRTGPGGCCGDFETSRRTFLRGAFTLAGAGLLTAYTGKAFTQVALAATSKPVPNVVVVLSLRGGADGLSLVVPHGDRDYEDARDGMSIAGGKLLVPDDMFGLHPNFAPLTGMWKDGQVAAVHSVGLSAPNRSHFEAMELVEDADPGSDLRRGWLNRLIGLDELQSPLEGVQMGSPIVPVSLYGEEPVLAVGNLNDMTLAGPDDPEAAARRRSSLDKLWQPVRGPLGSGALAALEVSEILDDVPENPHPPSGEDAYPAGDLGRALEETARLIRANVGVEVVAVDYGAWDMHAGLGDLSGGSMLDAITELSQAMRAFYADLSELGASVTVVTLTEFGRRVMPNASRGLDHGYGSVMLLAGAGVKGGKYYCNRWPGLDTRSLVDGDLDVTLDYRSVLAEVVKSRFDADVSKVFPDFRPESVGVMQM